MTSIRLPIAGLEAYVPAIEPGWLLLVEGGPEPDKEFFLEMVMRAISGAGGAVTLLTTRDLPAPGLSTVEARPADSGWEEVAIATPIVIDSFSLLCLQAPAEKVADGLRRMRAQARSHGALTVVCIDDGMLDARVVATIRHLADAVVQFRVRDDGDTVQTFLRIPRWGPRHTVPQPIHYQFTGDRLALDTRRRHV